MAISTVFVGNETLDLTTEASELRLKFVIFFRLFHIIASRFLRPSSKSDYFVLPIRAPWFPKSFGSADSSRPGGVSVSSSL